MSVFIEEIDMLDTQKKIRVILLEIENVTEKIEEKKILEKIVELSEEFLQSAGSELNYQKITDDILYISGAKYAVFILYDEDGSKFRTVAISAPAGVLKKASSLLGFKLIGKKWEHDPVLAEKIKSSTITHFSTLSELTGDFIAKPVVSLLWKTFNIGEVVLVKLIKKNVMLGSFTLIMPANVKFKNDSYVEIYTRQVGLLIARSKSETKLTESETRFKTIFQEAPLGIALTDSLTGQIYSVNPMFAKIVGRTMEEMKHIDWMGITDPDDVKKDLDNMALLNAEKINGFQMEKRYLHNDGTSVWINMTVAPIHAEDKAHPCHLAMVEDITERKNIEGRLKQQTEAMEATVDGMAILSKEEKYIYLNKAHAKIYGYDSPMEMVGKSWTILYDCDELQRFKNDIMPKLMENGYWQGEAIGIKKDGSKFFQDISLTALIEGGLICIVRNINKRKNRENEIVYLSYHDKLTELFNRRFVEEEIKRLDTKRQLPISIVMGDLNNLKLINDTFGHTEGDKILKETAELLKRMCRSDDILARWGGDEFVILLPKTSVASSEEVVARIKNECKKLINKKLPLSLAIGIATKTEESQNIDKIIAEVESNMYKNKLIEKKSNASSIIFALEQVLYEKSSETMEHALRIKDNAIKLGKSIKLHPSQLDELSLLASLHDIGKVAIPETILLKEGRLTEKEWTVIKRHPEIGFNIARSSPQIVHIAKFILACHENWDGFGYPQGLAGESIPLVSRIVSIADAYDVMISERAYKKTMSKDAAIEEFKRCAGTQFDPGLVEKFIEILSNGDMI